MINEKILENLEKISMLSLNTAERDTMLKNLNARLSDFTKSLDAVSASEKKIQPLVNSLEVGNVTRDDIVAQTLDRDAVMADAPEKRDGYFVVPKV